MITLESALTERRNDVSSYMLIGNAHNVGSRVQSKKKKKKKKKEKKEEEEERERTVFSLKT